MGKWDQYQVDTTPTTNKWAQFEISDSSQPVPSAQPVEAPGFHPLANNPVFQTLVTRPNAMYRSAVRGMLPGATETPQQGFMNAATAQGADLRQRAGTVAPLQQNAIEAYYQDVARRNPGQNPNIAQVLGGMVPSAVGLAGETAANIATGPMDLIAALAPFSRAGQMAGEAIAGSKAGQAVGRILTKEYQFGKKTFRTLSDIRVLPEGQLAKLPSIERQAYFSARNIEDQQLIAQERQVLGQKYQDTINKIRQDQRTLGQAAPAVAAKRLEHLSEPFAQLRVAQSKAYTNGIKEALAGAPEGDVFFTKDEINQALAQKYLQPSFPGQPPVMLDDPTEYRQLIDLLHNHEIVNKNEMSARDLLQIADKEFSGVSAASKGGLKSYTPPEVAHTKLRDILLNLLESKGIDVRSVKADWAQWVPIRNLGYKLQSPSGPSQVIRIVKGLDPVRAGHLDQLEALIGQPLRGEVRGLFNQLDELAQQKILEGTKQLEANRLLNQKIGFMKGSRIEQKLRIDQLAQHHDNVSKLIFEAAKGAAQAAGIGAVAGGAYLAHKALTQ